MTYERRQGSADHLGQALAQQLARRALHTVCPARPFRVGILVDAQLQNPAAIAIRRQELPFGHWTPEEVATRRVWRRREPAGSAARRSSSTAARAARSEADR